MKVHLILILILITTKIFSQDILNTPSYTAVIKGNVKNSTEKYWDFSITGYFNNSIVKVPIDDKGNFTKTIRFDGEIQDINLYINEDAFAIDIQKNDTIEINWNANDFEKTFKVKNTNFDKNIQVQIMLLLNKLYRKPYSNLSRSLYADKATDSVKYAEINSLFNQEMKTVHDSLQFFDAPKIAIDIYFKYSNLLALHYLLPKYELNIDDTSFRKTYRFMMGGIKSQYYKLQWEQAFYQSAEYRKFLYNYLRIISPIGETVLSGTQKEIAEKAMLFSPGWTDYYAAMAYLKIFKIRDWFIAGSIISDFEHYSYDDANAIYKDFSSKIKVKAYADTLSSFYKNVHKLKPGNQAPNFTVPSQDGKLVSLNSLKGKAIFIDFWGISCVPCIGDIKSFVPKLHEKYKTKNVVFVNICVDANNKEWRKSLKNLNLSGINLLAKGWTNNAVCQAYRIIGIPHYIIIDEDGKIADYNSPRPSEVAQLYTELDRVLTK